MIAGFGIRDSGFGRRLVVLGVLLAAACSGKSTPTTPSNTSKAMSESWSSVVAPGGTSSRSFTVNASGTITVTLTSAGAATLGLGVGVPRLTGGGCGLVLRAGLRPRHIEGPRRLCAQDRSPVIEAYEEFLADCPDYASTHALDALRVREYRRLDDQHHVYLDYTGGSLHAESQV